MIKKVLLIIGLATLLSGCIEGAMTGANVAYDRYDLANTLQDRSITFDVNSLIYQHPSIYDHSNIAVATHARMVLLAGQVPSEAIAKRAGELAATVKGVDKVYDFLTVGPNLSPWAHSKDTWITTKIKAQLLTDRKVNPDAIKVVTEAGVVYLMAVIPPDEAEEAVNLARNTDGVKEVVKIFKYVHLSEHPDVVLKQKKKATSRVSG